MQKEKKKIRIVCIMGKSGTGKSTVINDLIKLYPELFYAVKSYTTRQPRENDPEDLKTHEFTDYVKYNVDKVLGSIISLYESDKGYYSWTTRKSFSEDKINLYAIDPIACADLIKKHNNDYIIVPIYLNLSDEDRFERLRKRDLISELPKEEHLSYKHLVNANIEFDMIYNGESRLNNAMELLDGITRWLVILCGIDI